MNLKQAEYIKPDRRCRPIYLGKYGGKDLFIKGRIVKIDDDNSFVELPVKLPKSMDNKYRCVHCGKVVRYADNRKWIKSYCDDKQKWVHLQRVER
jgi:hypothetical protein